MNQAEIMALLARDEALLAGHFLLTSGRHSDRYIQCARVLQHPEHAAILCQQLAARYQGLAVDAVIGPAIGGILVAYELARHLGTRALFAEREQGTMRLRRGFDLQPGERVLVVEDVITTGGSVQEVIRLVTEIGVQVTGVATLVDRSNGAVELGYPLQALVALAVQNYQPEQCPLCQQGLPLVKPGSRGN